MSISKEEYLKILGRLKDLEDKIIFKLNRPQVFNSTDPNFSTMPKYLENDLITHDEVTRIINENQGPPGEQ